MGNHSKLVTKYGYFNHTPGKESPGNYPDLGKVPTQQWALSDAVYRIQKDGKDRKRVVVHFNRLKRCFANSREPSQTRARRREQRIPVVKVPPEFTVQARDHDSTDEEEELVVHSRRLPERENHELLRREEGVPTASTTEEPCTTDVFQREDMPMRQPRTRRVPAWMADYET